MVVILMGPAGAGKTTIGRLLADALHCRFVDGDDQHPPANVAKMSAGIPLDDEDRWPWLDRLREEIDASLAADQPLVTACSALRQAYRDRLRGDPDRVRLVYLKAPPFVLRDRLASRPNHFMKQTMLDSQLAALEEPHDALTLDGADLPANLVAQIRQELRI